MLGFLKHYVQQKLMCIQNEIHRVRWENYIDMSLGKGKVLKKLIAKERRFISWLRMI
jgi:hypothetical protein